MALIAAAFLLVFITVPAAFEALDTRFPPPLHRAARTSFEVVDREGELLRAFATEEGRWRLALELDDVDPRFIELLIAYEDRRFWNHAGVDPLALGRAAWQCVRYRRIVSGGSTITMQLARLIEPTRRRTLAAKFLQIFRALQIERRLAKPEILRLYLTLAPYGGNLEGLRAASLAWFGREPRHLPPADAAMLVALPQAPEARRPDRHQAGARAARDLVLRRLARAGALDAPVAEAAMARPAPSERREMPAAAPHLARALAGAAAGAGRVRTTLDAGLQARMEQLARDHTARLSAHISAAILVADAASGDILAHVGSPGMFDPRRDGAVDMTGRARSPGSTLKPLIYAIGFEDGIIAPGTLIDDRPSHFAGYAPENFDRSFQGTVTVGEALAASLNVPAVAVLDAIGPQRLLARLRRAGAKPVLPPGGAPGLAIGLGGVGLTLRDLVALYAAFARGGDPVRLRHLPGPPSASGAGDGVVSPLAAWRVREILRTVAPPDAAAGGRIAFKTGTSYGYRDAWSIGFDGRHVVGVWVGRADGAPVAGLTGRGAAAPLLFDAFARISPEPAPFGPPPAGMAEGPRTLPHGLRHFRLSGTGAAAGGEAPLVLAFPPDGSRLDRTGSGPDQHLVLKAEGGMLPLAWFANGRPVASAAHRRSALWAPDGPGFARFSVVDATGASARAEVFVETGR
jgi:penicillin-binding protein 1C